MPKIKVGSLWAFKIFAFYSTGVPNDAILLIFSQLRRSFQINHFFKFFVNFFLLKNILTTHRDPALIFGMLIVLYVRNKNIEKFFLYRVGVLGSCEVKVTRS